MRKYYQEMKEKQQKIINEFPFIFAFTTESLEKEMVKNGLKPEEKDKLISLGAGAFIKKEDKQSYIKMNEKMEQMEKTILSNPKKRESYMRDMCGYELRNHEYGYKYDLEDTVQALGYDMESIKKEEDLYKILLEEAEKIRKEENV